MSNVKCSLLREGEGDSDFAMSQHRAVTLSVGHAFIQKQDQNSSPATTAGRILQLPASASVSPRFGGLVCVGFPIQYLMQLHVLTCLLSVFLYAFVFWL